MNWLFIFYWCFMYVALHFKHLPVPPFWCFFFFFIYSTCSYFKLLYSICTTFSHIFIDHQVIGFMPCFYILTETLIKDSSCLIKLGLLLLEISGLKSTWSVKRCMIIMFIPNLFCIWGFSTRSLQFLKSSFISLPLRLRQMHFCFNA